MADEVAQKIYIEGTSQTIPVRVPMGPIFSFLFFFPDFPDKNGFLAEYLGRHLLEKIIKECLGVKRRDSMCSARCVLRSQRQRRVI